jgi:hypothetical protein
MKHKNIYGIFRRLYANDVGELFEIWKNELKAITRKDELAVQQKAYYWSVRMLEVK